MKEDKALLLIMKLDLFLEKILFPDISSKSSMDCTKLSQALVRYYGGWENYCEINLQQFLSCTYEKIRMSLKHRNSYEWKKYSYGKTNHNRIIDTLTGHGFKEGEFPLLNRK